MAVSDWRGVQIALEAKAATPSACLWARPASSSRIYYQLLLDQAIRCPDPFVRMSGKWLVRQLAPDSSPVEIETMNGEKEQDRLLHAMAWETANIHLGTSGASRANCRRPEQPLGQMAADGGQRLGDGYHKGLEGVDEVATLFLTRGTLQSDRSPGFQQDDAGGNKRNGNDV